MKFRVMNSQPFGTILTFASFNASFPTQQCVIDCRKTKSWVSDAIIEEGKFLRELFKLKNNNEELNERYQVLKKRHKKNIERVKKGSLFKNSDLSLCSTKDIWNGISTLLGKKQHRSSDKVAILGDVDAPRAFADYYLKAVYNKLTDHFGTDSLSRVCTVSAEVNTRTIFMRPVSLDEIYSTIITLPNKNSTGPDGVPIKVLKEMLII